MIWLFLLLFIFGCIIGLLLKFNKDKNKEIEDLNSVINDKNIILKRKDIIIENASQNLKALTDHQRVIQNIRQNHDEVITRIEKVKKGNDEEINNIMRDLINANNRSVSDSRKNNNG